MGYLLILGGAKSGKSRWAEARAGAIAQEAGLPVVYLATGVATDPEMAQRIQRHQATRPATWTTVEEPVAVAEWLRACDTPRIVLLDCLSFLLNNWMFTHPDEPAWIRQQAEDLADAFHAFPHPLLVVSNEVGQGIVPEHALARWYRDELGHLNQLAAESADTVIWMVAGLPVDVRRLAPQW